ncbi:MULTISPECIES: hypothetical protein [Subtercola]|uniref:DUF4333 domain-containing protein n=1 Tax=Subtercola vilae TaxID=2056433 RepID=A0A4T2BS27_9MICO|nr:MULTISPECIES: hypothetical protein [Subtercola]MEA9985202.1 hypothetical protein [Subtercola sp. RTI3]TIH34543.1 hypothetical protein D4765_12675 [Subtercola vilae]
MTTTARNTPARFGAQHATRRRARRGPLVATLAVSFSLALSFAVSGCSASASLTVPASEFATGVTNTLVKQVAAGTPSPTVDCGSDPIALVNDSVVHCDLTADDSPGVHYDTAVTISNVKGSDYHIDIKVADQPK